MENAMEVSEKNTKQYIVVKIGNEQYGLDINYIDNIVRMQSITRVPKAQTYFKGILNLRGEIVPVMSIRLKMELEDDEFTDASRIIILKIEEQGKTTKNDKSSFIFGIGKHGDELISLFDINAVVDESESVS